MKIGIDARGINWYNGTGIGTYTENVLKNLINIDNDNYYHIYWSMDNYECYQKPNTKIISTSRKHHRFFQDYFFPYDLKNQNIDLYHVPQNGIGLSSSINCKKIVTIHDLIPYIMPETVGRGYLLKFLKEMPNIIDTSQGIITVSEFSKRDILKFFPIDENKIFVTPLAADAKYKPLDKIICKNILKEKYNISKKFLLYLGGFSERKNVKSLITSFSKIYNDLDDDYNLVIVGSYKDESQYLVKLRDSLDMNDKIIFTGFVPDEDLPIFYNGCEIFVYPSLYEGFGLPPLEAMNCKTPVITSNLTSIPEVVGDGGILIDPYNSDKLGDAIGNLLSNETLKNYYAEKGFERAQNFSWENTAKNTLNIYKTVYETIV
ncbi:glycosyltransferase family 4 protein [Clostridium senegalense]|uniref:glycosyltransferase family 4 protein n=1 Tax=Clostridium senegalense TaxID=1465809 RepID=UPI001C108BE8|nr:glycosyltransferase family 1 protein [Clostridium senegalense]MBU5227475.1 glycosyltransferase family 4 protein [Clostridium senegalense]